jgi:hypothetical protein
MNVTANFEDTAFKNISVKTFPLYTAIEKKCCHKTPILEKGRQRFSC